jgi:hypothetical protein
VYLIVVLQQSLALASVLSLGHLGTTELGGMCSLDMIDDSVGACDNDGMYNRNSYISRNINVVNPYTYLIVGH